MDGSAYDREMAEKFDRFTSMVSSAAEILANEIAVGSLKDSPSVAKAVGQAIVRLEEAHMWAARAAQVLVQMNAKVESVSGGDSQPLTVIDGGKKGG